MRDLTKLQDMFLQLDPAAQKVIIDLMELLYRKGQVPTDLNIFDIQREVRDTGFAKNVDDFRNGNIPQIQVNRTPMQKKLITDEEKEDIEEFEEETTAALGYPEKDVSSTLTNAKDFCPTYRMKVFFKSGIHKLYKGQPYSIQNTVCQNILDKVKEIKKENPQKVRDRIAKYGWDKPVNDSKGKPLSPVELKNYGIFHLAALDLKYLPESEMPEVLKEKKGEE